MCARSPSIPRGEVSSEMRGAARTLAIKYLYLHDKAKELERLCQHVSRRGRYINGGLISRSRDLPSERYNDIIFFLKKKRKKTPIRWISCASLLMKFFCDLLSIYFYLHGDLNIRICMEK